MIDLGCETCLTRDLELIIVISDLISVQLMIWLISFIFVRLFKITQWMLTKRTELIASSSTASIWFLREHYGDYFVSSYRTKAPSYHVCLLPFVSQPLNFIDEYFHDNSLFPNFQYTKFKSQYPSRCYQFHGSLRIPKKNLTILLFTLLYSHLSHPTFTTNIFQSHFSFLPTLRVYVSHPSPHFVCVPIINPHSERGEEGKKYI